MFSTTRFYYSNLKLNINIYFAVGRRYQSYCTVHKFMEIATMKNALVFKNFTLKQDSIY